MTQRKSLAERPVRRRAAVAAVASVVGLTALVTGWPAASAAEATATEATATEVTAVVDWRDCPAYSDDVLLSRGITKEQIPEYRVQLERMECGTVSAPLDYDDPEGRQIEIALTRLGAQDRAHRLGSLAVNPGGPGGSGYLTPLERIMLNETDAQLNERYDLIGFDPRGVGYSSKVRCEGAAPGEPPAPGPLSEEAALALYNAQVAANQACGESDPAFLSELTTKNVARDLDRVRSALRERRLSFLGVSWGTWLGAVYRSEFPDRVGRMFLDSVASPEFTLAAFDDGRADAVESRFARLAAWIASHDDDYGLGTSAAEVRAAVLDLIGAYDDNPVQYTDLAMPVDGALVASMAGQDSREWPRVARAFSELGDATGTTAPPTVKEIFGSGPHMNLPGAPENFNSTMNTATFCNEDPGAVDFDAAWAEYRDRVDRNPVTSRSIMFSAGCDGWPLPAQEVQLRPSSGSLVLAGHRYEAGSPYAWTKEMRSQIGGTLFTVEDDVHGSVLTASGCGDDLVAYFTTGHIDRGCDGLSVAS